MSKVQTPTGFDAKKFTTKNLNEETVLRLKECFDIFDYDGSGNISAD
jgi:centrin-1